MMHPWQIQFHLPGLIFKKKKEIVMFCHCFKILERQEQRKEAIAFRFNEYITDM